MRTRYFLAGLVLITGVAVAGTIIVIAQAQTTGGEGKFSQVQYPVAELGNCASEAQCRSYCDNPNNINACLAFAERNNLMSPEELAQAKKFKEIGTGPGGCTSKQACESYCDDSSHISECIAFAERHNLIPPQELAEAKKVQAAIARGVKPPPCRGKQACDTYCQKPENAESCISFAEAAGFLEGKELEDAHKMLAAIRKGVKPPPCGGKEACDAYCGDESHFSECIAFAEAAGFMTPEDAERARKTGGKGPGGCRGKEECETFCNNEENQETCFNFGKEHGLIPEGDLRRMEEGQTKFAEGLKNAPPEVQECLKSALGQNTLEKLRSGGPPSQRVGETMRTCFEKFGGPKGPGEGQLRDGGQFGGPGGCKGPEECAAYCREHPDECRGFGPQGGEGQMPREGFMKPQGFYSSGTPPGNFRGGPQQGIQNFGGPGGCKTPEECQTYCRSNPEACRNFGSTPLQQVPNQGQQQFQQFQSPPEGFTPGQYPPPEPFQRYEQYPASQYPAGPAPEGGYPSPQPPPSGDQYAPPPGEPAPQLSPVEPQPGLILSNPIVNIFRLVLGL